MPTNAQITYQRIHPCCEKSFLSQEFHQNREECWDIKMGSNDETELALVEARRTYILRRRVLLRMSQTCFESSKVFVSIEISSFAEDIIGLLCYQSQELRITLGKLTAFLVFLKPGTIMFLPGSKSCCTISDLLPIRVQLYILSVLGFMVNFMQRTDINIALVAMVQTGGEWPVMPDIFRDSPIIELNETHVLKKPVHLDQNLDLMINETHKLRPCLKTLFKFRPEFAWSNQNQGIIQSLFYITYTMSSGMSGVLLSRIGPATLFGAVQLLSGLLSLLIPWVANQNPLSIILLRSAQGVLLGVTWPAYIALLSRWSAPYERSRFMSATQGIQLGIGFTYLISGALIRHMGWRSVFYFTGTFTILWFAFWVVDVCDDPKKHVRIKPRELKRIMSKTACTLAPSSEVLAVPWCAIITSKVVVSIAVVNFGRIWVFSVLHMYSPSYLKNVGQVDIKDNGIYNGIPFLISYFVGLPVSWLADNLYKKEIMSPLAVRKLMTAIAQIIPAVGLFFVSYTTSGIHFMVLLTICLCGAVASCAGSLVSVMFISPNFAGAVFGYIQFLFISSSMIAPMVVSYIVPDVTNADQWKHLFYGSSLISLLSYIPYYIFATEEVQPWNEAQPKDTSKRNNFP